MSMGRADLEAERELDPRLHAHVDPEIMRELTHLKIFDGLTIKIVVGEALRSYLFGPGSETRLVELKLRIQKK